MDMFHDHVNRDVQSQNVVPLFTSTPKKGLRRLQAEGKVLLEDASRCWNEWHPFEWDLGIHGVPCFHVTKLL